MGDRGLSSRADHVLGWNTARTRNEDRSKGHGPGSASVSKHLSIISSPSFCTQPADLTSGIRKHGDVYL